MIAWLIRLAFFMVLLYACMWLLRRVFQPPRVRAAGRDRRIAVSELVQDPVCKVYLPRQDALRLEHGGQTHYFCSRRCRRQYAGPRE